MIGNLSFVMKIESVNTYRYLLKCNLFNKREIAINISICSTNKNKEKKGLIRYLKSIKG